MKEQNIQITREALRLALEAGARKVRVTLARSTEDIVSTLNGEVDKVSHCEDSSLSFALFVDGRFGSFSTNRLEPESLRGFLDKAVGIVRMMAPDACRDLPSPERCCKNAVTGNELELEDPAYSGLTPEKRRRIALEAAVFGKIKAKSCEFVSEEGEYADSRYETVIMDSQGLVCLHTEDNFDYGVEVTIEVDGEKYSGYWWDSSSRLEKLGYAGCGEKAFRRAVGQIGSGPVPGTKCNMVIDSNVAS